VPPPGGRDHQAAHTGLQQPARQRVVDAGLHDIDGRAAIGCDLVDGRPRRLGQRSSIWPSASIPQPIDAPYSAFAKTAARTFSPPALIACCSSSSSVGACA